MKTEYIQELTEEQAQALQAALKVHFMPDAIYCEVTFKATPYRPAKTWGPPEDCYPEEGGEIEIESVEIMYLTCTLDEVPIMVNKQQKFIIAEFLDNDAIETACWEEADRLHDIKEDYYDY